MLSETFTFCTALLRLV